MRRSDRRPSRRRSQQLSSHFRPSTKQRQITKWLLAMTFFSYFAPLLSWRDLSRYSARTQIHERPVLDIQNPPAGGIARRRDSSIRNRYYTPSPSKLAGCPESDVAARCEPLEHNNSFEAVIIGVAAIDLELVRLNGDLILPRRSRLIGLDQLDVGIRVIDPDRSRASAYTCLFDTQCG